MIGLDTILDPHPSSQWALAQGEPEVKEKQKQKGLSEERIQKTVIFPLPLPLTHSWTCAVQNKQPTFVMNSYCCCHQQGFSHHHHPFPPIQSCTTTKTKQNKKQIYNKLWCSRRRRRRVYLWLLTFTLVTSQSDDCNIAQMLLLLERFKTSIQEERESNNISFLSSDLVVESQTHSRIPYSILHRLHKDKDMLKSGNGFRMEMKNIARGLLFLS